jgi:hypothetical protein
MFDSGELNAVNCAACTLAPCVNECQNLKISLLNSLLAGNFVAERFARDCKHHEMRPRAGYQLLDAGGA